MIRYKSSRQMSLEGFTLPFGGELSPENRWVKWSRVIPWDDLAVGYYKAMDSERGRPGKDARLIIGAVIRRVCWPMEFTALEKTEGS